MTAAISSSVESFASGLYVVFDRDLDLAVGLADGRCADETGCVTIGLACAAAAAVVRPCSVLTAGVRTVVDADVLFGV